MNRSGGSLRMTETGVRNTEAIFPALVADWWQMFVALELIASDPGAEAATRAHARRIVGAVGADAHRTPLRGQSDG